MKKTPALCAAAVAALFLLATAGSAAAKCRTPSNGPLSPKLVFPCASGTIHVGHNITWKVVDTNPKARKYPPFLDVTRRKPKHGILPNDRDGKGIYAEMKKVKGKPTRFTYKAKAYDFPGYWLITKGTWYVQVQQVDATAKGLVRYSPVEKVVVK